MKIRMKMFYKKMLFCDLAAMTTPVANRDARDAHVRVANSFNQWAKETNTHIDNAGTDQQFKSADAPVYEWVADDFNLNGNDNNDNEIVQIWSTMNMHTCHCVCRSLSATVHQACVLSGKSRQRREVRAPCWRSRRHDDARCERGYPKRTCRRRRWFQPEWK